jgi:outer membrane biosynthesis protein TonB
MRTNRSVKSVLLVLLVSGAFTGSRASAPFVQGVTANEAMPQSEKESGGCRGVVRLRPQQLLNLVIKQTPLGPPAMLHNSRLHGKVTVEASVDEMGTVTAVTGVRGHPFAVSSALESVRGWSFMPYKKNGEARCVVGLLTLNYDFRSGAGAHK